MSGVAPVGVELLVFDQIGDLTVFSPDIEVERTPITIQAFKAAIAQCDGLIISSPEYVRTIPGGLKNAIDWLVSSEELIDKPIVLAHASHRGDDMLAALRTVLSTVTVNFNADIFLRLCLVNETPETIQQIVAAPDNRERVQCFLLAFSDFCRSRADVEKPVFVYENGPGLGRNGRL